MPTEAHPGSKSPFVAFKNKSMETVSDNCVGCNMCQMACSWIKHGGFNPSIAYIDIQRRKNDELHFDALFTDQCDSCGFCAYFCEYDAIHLDTGKERATSRS